MLGEIIISMFFLIPLYGILIWTYFYPEESMLFGQRWRYKEEPEFTDGAITYTKFVSGIAIFFITIIVVSTFIDNYLIRVLLILGFFIYLIYRFFRLRAKLLKDG